MPEQLLSVLTDRNASLAREILVTPLHDRRLLTAPYLATAFAATRFEHVQCFAIRLSRALSKWEQITLIVSLHDTALTATRGALTEDVSRWLRHYNLTFASPLPKISPRSERRWHGTAA